MSARRLPRRLPRRLAAGALLALCAWAPARAHGDEEAAAGRLPQRVALLARAQSELERGDAAQALDDFERAAMMLHAPDAELGLIRAAMQDGQYRRALAFCAHTAGEHVDEPDGGALYAWLLRIGGQPALAARVIEQVQARAPGDALAGAVATAIQADAPVAGGALLAPLRRMAPWPAMLDGQAAPPAAAHVAANAVLVDDGTTALAPASPALTAAGARLWLRNGLGQTVAATVDASRPAPPAGLVRLRMVAALPTNGTPSPAVRAPFAGSPGYALQFGAGDAPAWPALAQGFLGNLVGDTGQRRLGFQAAAGAAVLDAGGTLAGIAIDGPDGRTRWIPVTAWAAGTSAAATIPAPASAPRTGLSLPAPDEIYEAGLRRALQVLVLAAS